LIGVDPGRAEPVEHSEQLELVLSCRLSRLRMRESPDLVQPRELIDGGSRLLQALVQGPCVERHQRGQETVDRSERQAVDAQQSRDVIEGEPFGNERLGDPYAVDVGGVEGAVSVR
jgi:hypothetical protein